MNKNKTLLTLIASILVFMSCSNNSETFLPMIKGPANEILVVMSADYWKSATGDSLKSKFETAVPGLGQYEPQFSYLWTPHSGFDKFYKRQRNIFIAYIGTNYPDQKITVQYDTWARSQMVITLTAPNEESFIDLLDTRYDEISTLISKVERQRLMNTFKANMEQETVGKLLNDYQIDLIAPKGLTVDEERDNFIWLSNEYSDIVEGVFIYYYPYSNRDAFKKQTIIDIRNQMMKNYVPGEIEGSYMTTETRFPIDYRVYYNADSIYTAEVRGYWDMKNGVAMGGPFISLTQYDKEHNRVVTLEGFVFAPGYTKRDLIRRLEAIIFSAKYPA